MLIRDSVDQALSIALKAMDTRPWSDLDPAVAALEKAGFIIQGSEDLQPIISRLTSAGRLRPRVMHRGGIGAHPKAFEVTMVLSD